MQRSLCKWIIASLVGVMFFVRATPTRADYLSDAGMGVLTLGSNVLYVPVKLGYAVLGGVTGSFAYVLTGANSQAAETIWTPSMGGDYVLTADHLRGQETIHFSTTTGSSGSSTSGWGSSNP